MLSGKKRLAVFSDLDEETPLELLLRQFSGFDVVFLEGYFFDTVLKIEVYQKGIYPAPLVKQMDNVLAVCAEENTGMAVPHFSASRLEPLAALIEDRISSAVGAAGSAGEL